MKENPKKCMTKEKKKKLKGYILGRRHTALYQGHITCSAFLTETEVFLRVIIILDLLEKKNKRNKSRLGLIKSANSLTKR